MSNCGLHTRLIRMCYTVAITPEELERIYWTMVPINTIASVEMNAQRSLRDESCFVRFVLDRKVILRGQIVHDSVQPASVRQDDLEPYLFPRSQQVLTHALEEKSRISDKMATKPAGDLRQALTAISSGQDQCLQIHSTCLYNRLLGQIC